MKHLLGKQDGSSLIFVFVALGFLASISFYVLKVNDQLSEQTSVLWQKTVADETAQSAFVLMESALARRLWSPPPNDNCEIQEDFSLTGKLENGATFEVEARYIAESKTIEMLSVAQFRKTESRYQKNLKIYDVSDYLILSKGTNPTWISAPIYSTSLPTSLIARDRKVYFEGNVQFYSHTNRPHGPDPDPNDYVPMLNPGEVNIILQSERMVFRNGLRYATTKAPIPDPVLFPKIHDHLKDLTIDYFGPNPEPQYYWQWGGGGVFITSDFSLANQTDARMRAGTPVNYSLIRKHFYPISLTNGTPPINATYASDTGSYFDDPNRWKIYYYSHGPDGTYGSRQNFSCYTEDFGEFTRHCSSSSVFPNGFKRWKNNADLDGILFTDDFEEIKTQTITWDNMDSLREDAQACGLYVNSSGSETSGSYQDCDLSDDRFVSDYISGKSPACLTIYRLDSESITSKLKNYSPAQYSGTNNKALKRVIYSEVPLEIVQSNQNGLATNINNSVRKNLPLWVVNEDVNILKPFQPDTTSPIDERPGEFREVYFNSSPNNSLESLKMVYISPERTLIHSPFHQPLNIADLHNDFPVVNGKIRPKYSVQTDWKHQENDGLKYGVRIVNVKNISLIDNTKSFNYNDGFFLRGLWSAVDSTAIQVLRNGCMLSPNVSEPISSSNWGYLKPTGFQQTLPPGHPALGVTVPPLSSRFYDHTSGVKISFFYRPYVFQLQASHKDVWESVLNFEGTRLGVLFSDEAFAGRRRLSDQRYMRKEMYYSSQVDLSNRSYVWNSYYWYMPAGDENNPVPCNVDPAVKKTPTIKDPNHIFLSRGTYTFTHQAPETEFNSVGPLFSLPLPMIKMRK